MKQLTKHLASKKSRYQKLTFFLLVVFPLLAFWGARIDSMPVILVSIFVLIGANLLAILNK